MPVRCAFSIWVLLVVVLASCSDPQRVPSPAPADTTTDAASQIGTTPSSSGHADLATAARAYDRAAALAATGQYDSARVHHEAALRLREARLGPMHPTVAASLEAVGLLHLEQGAYDAAETHLTRALRIRTTTLEAVHPAVASSHVALGRLRHAQGQYERALAHLSEATQIYDAPASSARLAEVRQLTGRAYAATGAYDRALSAFAEALGMLRTLHGEAHPDVAAVLDNIGSTYKDVGDYAAALQHLEHAVRILESTIGTEHPDIVGSYNNLGVVYDLKGDYEQAIAWYRRAVRVAETTFGSEHRSVSRGQHNIGISYFNKGDYEQATAYLTRALTSKEATLGAEHPSVGISHVSLGVVHKETGDRSRALQHYRTARSIFEGTVGERHPYVAFVLHNIGTVLDEQGRYDEALVHYRQSLEIEVATYGENHRSVAETYHNVANTYRKQSQPGQALAYHRRALAIAEETVGPVHPLVAKLHLSMGSVHRDLEAYDEALRAYQRSLHANVPDFTDRSLYANPRNDGALSDPYLLETLSAKAEALAARATTPGAPLSDLRAALRTSHDASRLIDRMRRGYQTEPSKLLLAEQAAAVYRHAIQTSIRLFRLTGDEAHVETAFQFSEKSKAGILLDALAEAEARQFAGIPDSLQARERGLHADLAFYERSLVEERLRGAEADRGKIAAWQKKVVALRADVQAFLQTLEREYPDYHTMKYASEVASPDTLRRYLLDAGTTLLSYSVGTDSIYIFTLTQNALDVTTVGRPARFTELVSRFRQSIVETAYDDYVEHARALYRLLIEPVQNRQIADRSSPYPVDRWIIIPDGVLNVLPFEALLTAAPDSAHAVRDYRTLPYLVNTHAVSYSYAATLLLETQRRARARPDRDFLAFAPVFADGLASAPRLGAVADAFTGHDSTWVTRSGVRALPASREEVTTIQARFRSDYTWLERLFGTRSRIYLEDDARESRLKNAAIERYRYVHLATHGLVSGSEPSLSRLLLAPEDTVSSQDGMLYLGEVYGLSLNADLVVLSACETGLGRLARGEGVIGLTRGFLHAGAQNVVVSLWQAPDAATRDVMVAFYDRLLDGTPRAEALQRAKQTLIRDDAVTAAPYYWATFVLVGR